jgi:flagellar FliL protein
MPEENKGKAENAEQKESVSAESKKKFPFKLIFILALSVIVLIAVGTTAYIFLSKGKQGSESAKASSDEIQKEEKSASLGPIISLDPFIVNLVGSSRMRYLKIALGLELSDEELQEEVDNKMPQVKDSILLLLSTKSYDDINTTQGKLLLREEIMRRLNGFLVSGLVKEVYFTDFVVQ